MPTKNYNVATAAKMVNVSASTIRGWCAAFAEHLSGSANPESGTERRLTDNYIALLQAAKELRDQGKLVADINQALGALPKHGLQPFVDMPATPIENTQPHTEQAEASAAIVSALQTIVGRMDALDAIERRMDAIDAIDRRLAQIEAADKEDREHRAGYPIVFMFGVIVGLVGLVLLLAIWIALK